MGLECVTFDAYHIHSRRVKSRESLTKMTPTKILPLFITKNEMSQKS
jgi:hypothetical protein